MHIKQFYRLNYKAPLQSDNTEQEWIKEWDQVLLSVFADLIVRLDGRTALLPLSGGCDSRTVAVMLKRLGYENVICFSYGKPGNGESKVSEQVALALGYKWYYIRYTGAKWGELYESDDYHAFLEFSGRGSGIGCVQALPAILELKKDGKIPTDAVVVPGHAMDFTAGSHISYVADNAIITKSQMINKITDTHYILNKHGKCDRAKEKWIRNIPDTMNRSEAINTYMLWEWHNRQTKFIGNDVRAYEYAGFGFEMPFWDIRVCRFWENVPAGLLQGRKLQYLHMNEKINPVAGTQPCCITEPVSVKASCMKSKLKKNFPALVSLLQAKNWLSAYRNNGNDFYGWMPFGEYCRKMLYYGSIANLNSFIASDDIARIREKMK